MTEVFLAMSITLSLLAKITTKVSDIELIVCTSPDGLLLSMPADRRVDQTQYPAQHHI